MNQLFMLGASVLAIALVVSMASAWSWPPWDRAAPQASPPGPPSDAPALKNIINAHECRADETCEVNELQSAGKVIGVSGFFKGITLQSDVGAFSYLDLVTPYGPFAGRLHFGLNSEPGSSVASYDVAAVTSDSAIPLRFKVGTTGGDEDVVLKLNPDKSAGFAGAIYSPTLSGVGNAYACLNENGQLFRSLTPCR